MAIYTFALSLLVCVPLTIVEIRKGNPLGWGRGGRTLGWFLLPVIFLPGAFAVYSGLASAPGSIFNDPAAFQGTNGAPAPLVTQMLSVSPLLWTAWIPILVYSGLSLGSLRSKAGWIFRRMGAALALFIILLVLSAAMWYALGARDQEWASATSNALFLVGVSSLVGFLSLFAGFATGTVISLPVLGASFAIPALAGGPLTRARAVVQAAPPRLASDHARLMVIVRLHGPKGHKDVEMLVDTGATNTNISPSLARDLGISAGFGNSTVTLADGRRVRAGRSKAIIEYGSRKAQVPIQISPVAEPLLGITTLGALGLKVDPVAKKLESSHQPRET